MAHQNLDANASVADREDEFSANRRKMKNSWAQSQKSFRTAFSWKLGGGADDSLDDNQAGSTCLTEYCDDFSGSNDGECDSDDDGRFGSVPALFTMFGGRRNTRTGSLSFGSHRNNYDDLHEDGSNNDDLDTNHRGEAIDEDHEYIFGPGNQSRRGSMDTSSGTNGSIPAGGSIPTSGGGGLSNKSNNSRPVEAHNQEQYEKEMSQLHKNYKHEELLDIFKQIPTQEAAASILNAQFDRLKKEMKQSGFVTDLALLQLSRGIVETTMIREIEKGEARKHMLSYANSRNHYSRTSRRL